MGRTLAFFLEGELTFLVIVLVLSTTTILASLFVVLSNSAQGEAIAIDQALTFPLFLGMLTDFSTQMMLFVWRKFLICSLDFVFVKLVSEGKWLYSKTMRSWDCCTGFCVWWGCASHAYWIKYLNYFRPKRNSLVTPFQNHHRNMMIDSFASKARRRNIHQGPQDDTSLYYKFLLNL